MRKIRILKAILLVFSLAIIIYFISEFVKYKFAATIVNTSASIDFAKLRNDGKIHIVIDALVFTIVAANLYFTNSFIK